MRKGNRRLKLYGRIMAGVILMSFLIIPVYGEPPTMQPPILSDGGTRLYSGSEVDLLIDDLSVAAKDAIEKAAAGAAKAAALASVEREAALLREKVKAVQEAQRWQNEAEAAKRAGRKNAVIAALVGVLGGLAVGISGTLLISR